MSSHNPVQVLEPSWEGPDGEAKRVLFWARVDADPRAVVIVASVASSAGFALAGVFSTLALAKDFAKGLGERAVVVPKMLDVPDWGTGAVQ